MHFVLGITARTGLIWLRVGFRDELYEDYDDSLGPTKGEEFDIR